MATFLRVSCRCPSLKDRRGRSNYLGSVQVDAPHIAHLHCKTCNSTWEFTVKAEGIITRRLITEEIIYTDEIAVIEVG